MTRQDVIAAIKRCAEKLGHVPTIFDLMKHEQLARTEIRKHFGSYKHALEECQLEVPRWGQQVTMEQVFRDWMEVTRTLKRVPTLYEYERMGKYRRRQLRRYFGEYARAAEGMKLYAEEHGMANEWQDVMELLRRESRRQNGAAMAVAATDTEADAPDGPACYSSKSKPDLPAGPVYGPVIRTRGFVYGPTNENGVLCLFGAMAEDLGFLIVRIQTGFPDVEAMRVMHDGRLRPVKIEAEYQSRNFMIHMHDPAGCDLIVCWEHNWPECPLEVIELKRYCQK